jgi:hypothetical protein
VKEEAVDHVAYTLHYALEDYECGWATWEQVEERVRQASAYYHWLYAGGTR